ncbi:hypothetical protein BDZ91DRAFT_766103 [Kalaharituber pfeilii]|nr:hypothetical protein BDZ91DRAFT_766103 [Kalaharituber pfeilii]
MAWTRISRPRPGQARLSRVFVGPITAIPTMKNLPDELPTPRRLVTAGEINESYFETRIHHVEFTNRKGSGGNGRLACLVMLEINFQPRGAGGVLGKTAESGRGSFRSRRRRARERFRFSEATVEVEFADAPYVDELFDLPMSLPPAAELDPMIMDYEPRLAIGAPSTAIRTTNFAIHAGVSPPPIDQLVPGLRVPLPRSGRLPSVDMTYATSKTAPTTSAAVIHGVLRMHPPRKVVWTMQENEVERCGIPRRVQVAMMVGYVEERRFAMKRDEGDGGGEYTGGKWLVDLGGLDR